ncbi:hypothetical protein [Flavobacterium sp.]|uniref:hypothetical protein n=1 Tax=Flavobacterium sp. TaxID=239 RepID=UPI00262F643A|nr:hypothetical protein [Flavobacterium sp.]
MKVGLVTKIFLGMAVAFTGLLGIMYLIYVSLSSVSSSDSNHRQEQFSSSASYINNGVTYTNNFCTECGAQCPRDTELHLIDNDMESYYLCGSSACTEAHNNKGAHNKNSPDYYTGSDGRVYESQPCGLCGGTGIEESNTSLGYQRRKCPMCDGRGHQNY